MDGSKEPNESGSNEPEAPPRQHLSLQDLGANGAADDDAMDMDDHTHDDQSHDPVQEQLAMEMAGHERMNGTYD
jgi:hypothetical protein